MSVPTPGRIVLYTLAEQDAAAINRRRKDAAKHRGSLVDPTGATTHVETGVVYHVGNDVAEGDVFPLVITRVWGPSAESAVNGQLFLDGNDLFWVTSAIVGTGPRTYSWPRVPSLHNPIA